MKTKGTANKTRKSSDAQIRAALKWASANIKQVKINLNYESDADIIAKLESEPNKQGYIKAAIREYMAKH